MGHHHGKSDTAVHRMPVAPKLAAALALILGTVLLPWRFRGWFIGVTMLLIAATLWSRLSPKFLLKRLFRPSPFVLGVALVNAFHPEARGTWTAVAARSALCLATVILVSNTTPFSQILRC